MSDNAPPVLDLISAGYSLQFKEKGATHEGVLWSNKEDQIKRFDTFMEMVKDQLPENDMSVNDLGCGYGALFEYLRDHPAMANGRYYGYDICADFISVAMMRYTDPRALFLHHYAAYLEADFSFVSGTFNMKGPEKDEDWDLYVKQALKDLFTKTNKAMAFNMLTPKHPNQHDWLYYCDPDALLDFCRKGISSHATIKMEPDMTAFTICVSKE